jgi:hypothetical protein
MRFMKYIVLAVLAFAVFSCETTEKIDDFPLRPARLVANCYFAADSVWEVQVSQSLSVLDNANLKLVEDARVLLYRDSTFIDTIRKDFDGLYRSAVSLPVEKRKYSIQVTTPKFKTPLSASAVTPARVPISDVTLTIRDSSIYRERWPGEEEHIYGDIEGEFGVVIDDPGDTENYYELRIYQTSTYEYWEFDSLYTYVERYLMNFGTDDPVAEDYGSDNEYLNSILFSDEIFNGQKYEVTLKFDDWINSNYKIYSFELKSLTREGYLYRRTIEKYEQSSGDPFSEPVVIYSNIENGYGIFAGYALSDYHKQLNFE